MQRKIINIDKEKCNGCGACASACHEGAIEMRDGVATLIRDDYCDGFGDCLPVCPTGAISFTVREAAAYDEEAVACAKREKNAHGGGCPGQRIRIMREEKVRKSAAEQGRAGDAVTENDAGAGAASELMQWPCQIRLVPASAPFFDGAELLIAADCTAYAYAALHRDFMRGRVTLIGCPKLDPVDYAEKLGEIIAKNNIRSLTVVRMEVPCCGGLEAAARRALAASGRFIPSQVVIISTDGRTVAPGTPAQ